MKNLTERKTLDKNQFLNAAFDACSFLNNPFAENTSPRFERISDYFQTNYPNIVLFICRYVPKLNPLAFYLLFDCSISSATFRTVLSRLMKKGELASVPISAPDITIHKAYYITKEGAKKIDALSNFSSLNQSQASRQPSKNAFHDFGVGMATMSLLYSDLLLESIGYERPYTVHPASVEKGKAMVRSLRPDAIFKITSRTSFCSRIICLEQDTGTENIFVLIKKIQEYILHDVLSFHEGSESNFGTDSNCIIFSSHAPIVSMPDFFIVSNLERYAELADKKKLTAESIPASLKQGLRDYISVPISLADGTDLRSLSRRISRNTDSDYIAFLRQRQRNYALRRRTSLSEALTCPYSEFLGGRVTDLSELFRAMLEGGFCMPYAATCDLPVLYPALFLDFFPAERNRLKVILSHNFGAAEYVSPLSKIPFYGASIRMRNAFYVPGKNLYVYAESACDIGALFRARRLNELAATGGHRISILFLCTSFEDAAAAASFTKADCSTMETCGYQNDRVRTIFLLLTEHTLFALYKKDDKDQYLPVFLTPGA